MPAIGDRFSTKDYDPKKSPIESGPTKVILARLMSRSGVPSTIEADTFKYETGQTASGRSSRIAIEV
jgi:hypothetical protein